VILLLSATALLCVAFALVFRWAKRIDNFGVVDVAWAYAFAPTAVGFALAADGWAPRRLAVAVLATAWSLRLGTHLYRRVMGHHPVEDGRYQAMRAKWGTNLHREMARFYQIQAVSVLILALPFFYAVSNPAPAFHPLEIAGAGLLLLSVLGEALADAQLNAFKRRPDSRGRVCREGLWSVSRHPNYFFEWLAWVGFALIALPAPFGWAGILSPLAILYLLLRVTGIPLTEEQTVRSKGEAYRAYQREVSPFVPWPRRKAAGRSE
jgi:steroid 5-alpha reductase family enzyme